MSPFMCVCASACLRAYSRKSLTIGKMYARSCSVYYKSHITPHCPSPLPTPRASDPTSPRCSTHAPISGARPQGWEGPHDHMDRAAMAVGGVAAAEWGACHVFPSSRQEHQQGVAPPSHAHPLPPCQEAHPESSTPQWLGTTLLHKVWLVYAASTPHAHAPSCSIHVFNCMCENCYP